MTEETPIIYLSKRCEHCLTLLELLRSRDDLNGNYKLIMIDEEPFPNYVKAVPCMVSSGELFNAKEIFMMLEQSNTVKSEQNDSQPPTAQSSEQCSSEMECSVDGYCQDGSCLEFSSLNGDDGGTGLDSFYNQGTREGGQQPGEHDDIRRIKSNKTGNDYERLLQERGELQPMQNHTDR